MILSVVCYFASIFCYIYRSAFHQFILFSLLLSVTCIIIAGRFTIEIFGRKKKQSKDCFAKIFIFLTVKLCLLTTKTNQITLLFIESNTTDTNTKYRWRSQQIVTATMCNSS